MRPFFLVEGERKGEVRFKARKGTKTGPSPNLFVFFDKELPCKAIEQKEAKQKEEHVEREEEG